LLTIRLRRVGKHAQPSFRVILQEHTSSPKNKAIEELGYYKPAANPIEFSVKMEKIKYWISKGAKPSDTVAVLLKKEGVDGMDKFISPRNKQRKRKGEQPAEAAAPAPAPKAAAPAPAPKAEAPAAPVDTPKA